MTRNTLLFLDGLINLALGIVLITFPDSLVAALGIPKAPSTFYPNLLGGVLCGIGIALFLERSNRRTQVSGLGLGGAMAINLSGGVVLAAWLIFGNLLLPFRGVVLLWALVFILAVISILEALGNVRRKDGSV